MTEVEIACYQEWAHKVLSYLHSLMNWMDCGQQLVIYFFLLFVDIRFGFLFCLFEQKLLTHFHGRVEIIRTKNSSLIQLETLIIRYIVLFDRNVTCTRNSSHIPFYFVCIWSIRKCCYSNFGCNSNILWWFKPPELFRNCARIPWNNYICAHKSQIHRNITAELIKNSWVVRYLLWTSNFRLKYMVEQHSVETKL